jgi:hypothetical protein
MADEQSGREELQARRARQYAVCTYALDHDRATDGAEGVFDQALTNGLAAIVAHEWPGEEVGRRGRMLAAAGLLDVLEQHGKHKDDGVVAILRPGEPEYTQYPFEDEPMPNYTAVNVTVVREALSATQAIRHARDSGEPMDTALTGAHIAALRELDHHPALYALSDEVINRAECSVIQRDRIEQNRALDYWHSLGDAERGRREMIDYEAEYAWETPGDRCEVQDCPVCWQRSLVAGQFDSQLDEIGIGWCAACSYERTREVADDAATTELIRRAVERDN